MNIAESLDWASQELKGLSSARLDAGILLSHYLRVSRSYLYTWPEKAVPESIQEKYTQAIFRRKQGEPVAYITGEKGFWSLTLTVTSDVLIPRPETELIIESVLSDFSDKENLSILDLGTGSGAIAIALAHEKKHWHITASDISEKALGVAKKNIERYQLKNIQLIGSDWYDAIGEKKFEVIVSNPPYIDEKDPYLCGSTKFEPRSALISADNGLSDIKKIIEEAKKYLSETGVLYIEHGFQQAKAIRNMFKSAGFVDVSTYQDLSGLDRMTNGLIQNLSSTGEGV